MTNSSLDGHSGEQRLHAAPQAARDAHAELACGGHLDDYELDAGAISNWAPDEGWDAGWEVGSGWGDGEVVRNDSSDVPLGLPVIIPEDAE